MCDYEPISDEMLFGVPVDKLPDPDTGRNFFDENQAILTVEGTEEKR